MKLNYLKYWTLFIFVAIFSLNLDAQFSLANVEENGVERTGVVRYSVDWGMNNVAITKKEKAVYLATGLLLSNKGFIYKDEVDKWKHRALGISIPLSIATEIGKSDKSKLLVFLTHEFTYNFHYKRKQFEGMNRSNKKKFTDNGARLNNYYPSFGGGIGIGPVALKVMYHYADFFDKDFEEVVDGVTTKPYENFKVSNHITLGLFFGFTNLKPRKAPGEEPEISKL